MQSTVLRGVLASVLLLGTGALFAAQGDYPSRPLRMIVPFQPGGASDFAGRIIQPRLAQELGQNIVVENRVGASGYVGVETAARATADGYTFILGNIGTMAINASVFPKFKVKPLQAFIGVSQVVDVPGMLVVHPSIPVKSVKEFIAYAKARPGKLNFSASGAGSNSRLAMEYFKQQAGLDIVMVAYKGGAGGASLGVVQGEVQMTMLTSSSLLPFVRTGRLRLLAVIAPERLSAAPDTPTMKESGFPGLVVGSWQGVFVPKGTSQSVVNRLFPAVVNTMKDPEVVRRLGTASAASITSKSPADFRRFWESENKRWAKVVHDIGAVAH
ncbi:MAG: tripartite tricarboxylate transporter substrate binding protein [Betaproteobacteria bacterium]|nr:tripartite tricarboxylate transporter substrate binding protein [Betaproteobacteria bacterium]MDH3438336.1 tripartite tricarboxylate transporter substrate binding protein [Betaproteobacteria bacterium]